MIEISLKFIEIKDFYRFSLEKQLLTLFILIVLLNLIQQNIEWLIICENTRILILDLLQRLNVSEYPVEKWMTATAFLETALDSVDQIIKFFEVCQVEVQKNASYISQSILLWDVFRKSDCVNTNGINKGLI